ncbi:MAG: TerC family protein [Gemmatimonadaceae bacterium]
MHNIWSWVGFNALILGLLALDLGVFHRESKTVSVKEALGWSAVWVALAILFGVGIAFAMGREPALEFFAGYVVEEALSVDNLFVFIVIFGFFKIPAALQHRVLFWGILGALLLRGLMIGTGALLIAKFHAVIFVFGAFLVFTGIRMAFQGEASVEPEANPVIRLVRRIFPVTTKFHDDRFFVRTSLTHGGPIRLVATPLLVVLVLVETTDVMFALDSIPAVFGVTKDPFLVYTSNVFAILGLRSMFFVLSGVIGKFHLLKYGLSVVLAFVGTKMLISDFYEIPIGWSLGAVAGILATSVGLSLVIKPKPEVESRGNSEPPTDA